MPNTSRDKPRGLSELDVLDAVFRALAHASRRHILQVIRFRGGQMTAGEIADRFACSWPTTTAHLRKLEEAGLLRVEPRGRERVYMLNAELLCQCLDGWVHWFRDSTPNKDEPHDQ